MVWLTGFTKFLIRVIPAVVQAVTPVFVRNLDSVLALQVLRSSRAIHFITVVVTVKDPITPALVEFPQADIVGLTLETIAVWTVGFISFIQAVILLVADGGLGDALTIGTSELVNRTIAMD